MAASAAGIPIRIGFNAGPSTSAAGEVRQGTRGAGRVRAVGVLAVRGARLPRHQDLGEAHDPVVMIQAYRQLARSATTRSPGRDGGRAAFQGTVKSAAAFGALLAKGIGARSGCRCPLRPAEEDQGRHRDPVLAGPARTAPGDRLLPSCGRAQVDVYRLADEVDGRS